MIITITEYIRQDKTYTETNEIKIKQADFLNIDCKANCITIDTKDGKHVICDKLYNKTAIRIWEGN